LGDLSTIVFTLGLNQPPSDDNTPFWLLEGRKRVMGHAFSADKQMATFLGRPPRISWRFCNVSLPLDISFKDAIAEPSVREIALSRLNANGWNTIESDMQAVWLRVALLMGPVREKILELSLNQQADDLPARIK
jgi:chromatin structure-remodeling complex subunit RSC3/30